MEAGPARGHAAITSFPQTASTTQEAAKFRAGKGGEMKVAGLTAKVEEVLKITQLFRVFPEFPSEEEVLGSFPESSV